MSSILQKPNVVLDLAMRDVSPNDRFSRCQTEHELKNNSEVTDHPAFGGFQGDRPVAVHGRLEKLPGADVPEQDEADPGPDGQNVALEGDGSDSAAVVPRRNFLDGLKRSGRQN